jgi:hypothetical protein
MPPSGRVPPRPKREECWVDFFEDSEWRSAQRLSAELVAYHRYVLTVHANDPVTGRCRTCGISGCLDWRSAYDQLAMGGAAMAERDVWMPNTRSGMPWR